MRENLWAWQLCEEQEHHLSGGRRIKSMGPISWYVQVRPTTSRRIRFGVFCLNRNSREFEFLTHISPDHILLFLKLKLKPAQRVDAWTENLKYLVEELSDAEVTHFSRWFAEEVSVSLSGARRSSVVGRRVLASPRYAGEKTLLRYSSLLSPFDSRIVLSPNRLLESQNRLARADRLVLAAFCHHRLDPQEQGFDDAESPGDAMAYGDPSHGREGDDGGSQGVAGRRSGRESPHSAVLGRETLAVGIDRLRFFKYGRIDGGQPRHAARDVGKKPFPIPVPSHSFLLS